MRKPPAFEIQAQSQHSLHSYEFAKLLRMA
ncbi:hypothetical protein HNQ65_001089 [Prosthecobacter vanneervenii]|uniref:Uncharacterized protein n=1 Tax=Prosthecobacter vanneervenii TaxID=48466 RepID=A0A7W8DJ60_9BACT|nr:hypothetical protein [Prosthecobacter vanneervenii]